MDMLNPYKPKSNELIYHYCDSDTFNSICQNKTIRLSDLFSMNDGLEIKWGYSIWIEVANLLLKELGHEFIDEIDKIIHGFGLQSLIISSSFSFQGDILSQWRAYASDGNGYCIGFDAKQLFQLPILQIKIIYDKKAQVKKVSEIVKSIYDIEKHTKEKFGKSFFELCFYFAVALSSMKNPSFVEEKEIRIIHLLTFKNSNCGLKLTDVGGVSFGKATDGQEIKYRIRDNSPIAYQDYGFSNEGKSSPMKQVILGPKNRSLPTGVSIFLETIGIENVDVIRSSSSYI